MRGDFLAELPDFDPFLPRSVLGSLIKAQTAAVHELNGRIERAARNAFADTAEETELERIGALYGVSRDQGGIAAGSLYIQGTVGTSIPTGTFFVLANGLRYQYTGGGVVVANDPTLALDVAHVVIEATARGAEYNLDAGTSIELEEPISGITPGTGTVEGGGIAGGSDLEELETYRANVLDTIRQRPQGGTLHDFERWTFESNLGFTRVWVIPPAAGSNLIEIYAVDDKLDPDGNSIFPIGALYSAAEGYVDADHRRPLCADVSVSAPTPVDLDPAITLTPNTAEVQAAVKEEIIQLLIREAEIGGTLPLTHLEEVVSRAAGETERAITSPVSDVSVSPGELLVIGTPVFS